MPKPLQSLNLAITLRYTEGFCLINALARASEELKMLDLPRHHCSIALLQPQIAPNTGNIARLCVTTGTDLHLVRPLGFVLSDKQLRRSAMDYWPRLRLTMHDTTEAFIEIMRGRRIWFFDSAAGQGLWDVRFLDGDVLVFGSETQGIPPSILRELPERTVRLPQSADERCLNLATAAGIGIYEALRQVCQPSTSLGASPDRS